MNRITKSIGIAILAGLGIAGCAPDRHSEIPQGANLVAEGNRTISYQAPAPGMVWVYNKGNGNMEYAGRVTSGDQVVVDLDHNKITLNGRNVNDKPLSGLDDKRIYFQADYPNDRRYGSMNP